MLRHFFFDLVGTLVRIVTDEAAPETSASFERWVAQHLGQTAVDRERAHPFLQDLRAIRPAPVLHAEPDIAPVVLAHLQALMDREPSLAQIAQMAEAFRTASRRELTVVPGAREALAALKKRFGVGLISNAQLLFTRPELQSVGLPQDLFEPLLVSSQFGVRKPSRHIFAAALEQAKVEPHEALYVGNDPCDDVEGAAAAGLHTCLVDDPRLHKEIRVPPDLHLGSVAQLPLALSSDDAPAWVRGQ